MLTALCLIISVGLIFAEPIDKDIKPQSYNPGARPLLFETSQDSTPNPVNNHPAKADLENGPSLEEKKSSKLSGEKGITKPYADTRLSPSKKIKGALQSENSNSPKTKANSPIKENKNKGTYLILAPKVIRPGRPYLTTVSVKNVEESMMVNIVIQKDGNNTLRNEVKVKEGKPVKVTFQIPEDFRDGDYKLIAFGLDENQNYIILNHTDLEYQSKIASVFLQTDKPAYKRSQLVRFRVIITDPDLKPYTGQVNIYLNCPLNFRIAQWEHILGTSGVISKEYQLQNDALIGIYQIVIEIQDEIIREPLLIVGDEGVLPKFEVLVESPNYVLYDGSAAINVKVTAKYPFNKAVNGSLELSLQEDIEYYPSQVKQIGNVVNGEAVAEIPIKVIKFPKNNEEKNFIIIANVTDSFTGTYHIGSKHVILFRDKYRVTIIPASLYFKPGLKFQAWVKLEKFDGGSLPDENVKINISYSFTLNEENSWKKDIYSVEQTGLVELNIFPDENTTMIYIKADYQGFKKEFQALKKVASVSKKFIQITSYSLQYNAGDKAVFFLNSTEPIPNINVVVFARNNIISTGIINMKNQNIAKITLPITDAMIPSTLIVVYYLTDEGQVLVDYLNLTIRGPFANNISISFYQADGTAIDPEREIISPGSQILVSGMTAPNSHVFINVMDESAYLLKPVDFLTVRGLYGELNEYQGFKTDFSRVLLNSGFEIETDLQDACRLLKESGFAVLTNGCELQEGKLESGFNAVINAEVKPSPFSTTEVKGDILPHHPTKSKIKVRRNFPETWLWIDTKASSDGKFENLSIIPETMTTWIASAFSMNSVYGLGLIEYTAKVQVSHPFIVILNIPYSAKRNKNLIIDALIFHAANEAVEVTVKLDKSNFYQILQTTEEPPHTHKISLEPDTYGKVSFNIIPLVTGIIPIRVSASSSAGRDSEERKIIIQPEGLTQLYNDTMFMKFGKRTRIGYKFKVKIEKENVVPDSDKAVIFIQGNGFGLPMKHVEQGITTYTNRFATFPQNLAVFQYLDVTSQFSSNYHITKYLNQLKKDYEEILKLRRKDGYFVAPDTSIGNPIVTSFAIRYLTILQEYITIDYDVIKSAEKWLTKKQSYDGSFGIQSISGIGYNLMDIPPEHFVHTNNNLFQFLKSQNNISDDILITVDIFLNLLQSQYPLDRKEIVDATSYLERFVNRSENVETLAKLAYALTLVKSSAADVVFQNLKSKFNVDVPPVDTDVNIIALSYLILILINRGEIGKAQLFSQSLSASLKITSLSTWETARALDAMSLVAVYAYHPETAAEIEVRGGEQFSHRLSINYENVNLLQRVEVPNISNLEDIKIIAEGIGSFLVSILWMYNIPEQMNASFPGVRYYLNVKSSFHNDFLILTICCSSSSTFPATDVLNVEFPVGYKTHEVDRLVDTGLVGATETHDHNAFIFFKKLSQNQTCLDVKAISENGHQSFQDIPVTLFDYDNPQHTVVMKKYSSPIKTTKQS